jgi:UDP-glucose 4-epimerase
VNYVSDVVSALLTVGVSSQGWGQAYNLGGTPVSLVDFVKKTIDVVGKGKLIVKPFPKDREAIEVGDYIASYKKMTKMYGWKPVVSLDDGIKRTVEYYRKNKMKYW